MPGIKTRPFFNNQGNQQFNPYIPVNQPLLDGNEKKYLNQCIDTGWISSEGSFVPLFEERMAAAVGRRYGIAVCSGTAALEAAVAALELQPGDEVILPTFTIISCAAAVIRNGCVPVLVDSDPVTWNMDVSQVEAKITRKTRAVMAVHIYGLPVDIDPLMAAAEKHGLKIIEDAAQMHGQTYRDRPCGSFGDISVFSFYANKHVAAGEGGMLLTDNRHLAERCRQLRNLCFIPEKRYVHYELGYNFRLTNLQAAVGLAQLERLDEFVSLKRAMGKRYTGILSGVPGLKLPLSSTDYAENIYWVYGLMLKDDVPFVADEVIRRLDEKDVGSRPFFWPMHLQPVFHRMRLFKDERYPSAEKMAERGFYIPSGIALTPGQMKMVAKAVKTVVAGVDP